MDDLTAFATARLAEDEALAKRGEEVFATGWPDYETYSGTPELNDACKYLDRFGPARALREVAAGRRILARHSPAEGIGGTCCAWCSDDTDTASLNTPWPCPDVRDLLSRWSGHPGYRPDFRALAGAKVRRKSAGSPGGDQLATQQQAMKVR